MYIGPTGYDNMVIHLGLNYLQVKLGIINKHHILKQTNYE